MFRRQPFLKKIGEETRHRAQLFFFAPTCSLCGTALAWRDERYICRDCLGRIVRRTGHHCRFCGKFMGGETDICGECALSRPPFLRHRSFAAYEDPLKQLIHAFKYGEIAPLGETLAALLLELLVHEIRGEIDAVTATPPDPSRRRSFHPPHRLARVLAVKTGIPFRPDLLVKTVSTPPQVSLDAASRRRSLRRVFQSSSCFPLQGKRILLIDDVYTTGATMKACAAPLAAKGARVIGLSAAQSTWGQEPEISRETSKNPRYEKKS